MKLRNKKTGEIGELMTENYEFDGFWVRTGGDNCPDYKDINYYSLAELNEEWEDYEEPKSGIEDIRLNDVISGRHIVEIDFTKVEDAEKAVEKLKAYKRLRDRDFTLDSFEWAEVCDNHYRITFSVRCDRIWLDMGHSVNADLNLLFGGEE